MKLKVLKLDNTSSSVEVDLNLESSATTTKDASVVVRVARQAEKQGTKKAKGRSEVRGGSAKPYRQKGTGNARQGSRKGPHFIGGGVAHGPTPDFTKLKLNKKYKALALKNFLAEYVTNDKLSLVDLDGKSEELRKFFGAQPKSLVVYSADNKAVYTALRNLDTVETLEMRNLGPSTLLSYDQIFVDLKSKDELVNLLASK